MSPDGAVSPQANTARAPLGCVGWQYAPAHADPGPPPARPASAPSATLNPGWVRAQREIARVLARPARFGGLACAGTAVLAVVAWLAGLAGAGISGCAMLAALAGAAACTVSLRRGQRKLDAVIAAERQRVAAVSAAAARRLADRQREHASGYRAWQRLRARYERQPLWFAVPIPAGIDRIDVAGGTLAGWSALVTTMATAMLSAGGEVTVVDLTEVAVAGDLISLATRQGVRPLVWVLPADLPRLDLGAGLGAPALADVLALAASASGQAGGTGGIGGAGDQVGTERVMAEQAADCALLERVLEALGSDPPMAAVTAALRVLADMGDPRPDLDRGLLTAEQLDRIRRLFGRGAAERLVIERAWLLESRLRRIDQLGAWPAPELPARLRVASIDRRSGVISNRMLGTFVIAALTHMLRQAGQPQSAGRAAPWAHAIFLLGAERLAGEVLDRLSDACEASRTGLVLAYRSIPAGVRSRLGRGNAVLAFMRLGNGDDARAASELIGTEHRFVVGQLTDTIGLSVSDTWGGQYTSTAGRSDSLADTVSLSHSVGTSRGRGLSRQGRAGPFGDFSKSASRDRNYSTAQSGSVSLTRGINSGTSWGLSLSRALSENASLGRTAQRSREFLVEPDQLQRLPPTAAIVSYPGPAGRTVVLADTNPAIMTLPRSVLRGAEEVTGSEADDAEDDTAAAAGGVAVGVAGRVDDESGW